MIGLETTMMGADNLGQFDELPRVSRANREQMKNEASFETFEAAVATGTGELEEYEDEFFGDSYDYQLVAVSDARAEGIMPIGFSE